MDRSLWVLTRLRLLALHRRWKRSLSRPRGILTTVIFGVVMMPSIITMIAVPFIKPSIAPTGPVERFAPIGFLVVTLVSIATSTGETALFFRPAEVDFLFAGPYSRRQLVGYKLIVTLLASVTSALFFGIMGTAFSPRFVSAFAGALLTILFLQTSQIVVGLGIGLVGAAAWGQGRRWALLGLLAVAVAVVLPSREDLVVEDWMALGLSVEASPITRLVLTPFRWFVNTYTARSSSGLIGWGSLALAVDLALIALVFLLDAGYLEASALASSRRLAKARKAIKGGGTIKLASRSTGLLRLRPPKPAWLGGLGPNLWRQMVSALGNPGQTIALVFIVGVSSWIFGWFLQGQERTRSMLLPLGLSVAMPLTILLSLLLAFDFRGDLDVMETLKTLPISPTRLAVGQVLTPALLASAVQAVGCLGLVGGAGGPGGNRTLIAAVLAFLLPANLFFYEVENLLFLWYPSRTVAGQFNGTAMIRQMLVLLGKGVALGFAAALVGAVGALAYFALGRHPGPALALSWSTLVGLAIALMPLLGRAFDDFDVSTDIPA